MRIAVFHGSPRKGNTYTAAKLFLEQLGKRGETRITEFFLPEALPVFCTGCQLCMGNPRECCPHARDVDPIAEAIFHADALVFATPHHGAGDMSAGMKNLLDHLAFLTLNVAPRPELFAQKAFVITTGTGSVTAKKPLVRCLKHWGVNRIYALGLRMMTDAWDKMPASKRFRYEKTLRRAADRFAAAPKRFPYLSTIGMYHASKFILKKYVGEDAYPYRYWEEKGYFRKRPF